MASIASLIPIRANGGGPIGYVTASWWNIIRTALLALFGDESATETAFTVVNNQAGAADVTACLVSSASSRGAVVKYDIRRKSDTALSEVRAVGTLVLGYRLQSSAWEILGQDEYGDTHGVTFTVTAAGQVQYTSTNLAGANYVGELRFKVESFND